MFSPTLPLITPPRPSCSRRATLASGGPASVPEAARAETLAFLGGEVRDLSVSRVVARSDGWGIPVPGDPTQVIYVWFDALANYVASLGLGGDEALLERFWHRAGERAHVIGGERYLGLGAAAVTREGHDALLLELRLPTRQHVSVDAEAVRDLRHRTALLHDLLHRLELELAAVLPAGTAHRFIVLLEPRDSYLGVHFRGARSPATFRTLMADLLLSRLEGEPLPLENDLVDAVNPGRFLLRAAQRAATDSDDSL